MVVRVLWLTASTAQAQHGKHRVHAQGQTQLNPNPTIFPHLVYASNTIVLTVYNHDGIVQALCSIFVKILINVDEIPKEPKLLVLDGLRATHFLPARNQPVRRNTYHARGISSGSSARELVPSSARRWRFFLSSIMYASKPQSRARA